MPPIPVPAPSTPLTLTEIILLTLLLVTLNGLAFGIAWFIAERQAQAELRAAEAEAREAFRQLMGDMDHEDMHYREAIDGYSEGEEEEEWLDAETEQPPPVYTKTRAGEEPPSYY